MKAEQLQLFINGKLDSCYRNDSKGNSAILKRINKIVEDHLANPHFYKFKEIQKIRGLLSLKGFHALSEKIRKQKENELKNIEVERKELIEMCSSSGTKPNLKVEIRRT